MVHIHHSFYLVFKVVSTKNHNSTVQYSETRARAHTHTHTHTHTHRYFRVSNKVIFKEVLLGMYAHPAHVTDTCINDGRAVMK